MAVTAGIALLGFFASRPAGPFPSRASKRFLPPHAPAASANLSGLAALEELVTHAHMAAWAKPPPIINSAARERGMTRRCGRGHDVTPAMEGIYGRLAAELRRGSAALMGKDR